MSQPAYRTDGADTPTGGLTRRYLASYGFDRLTTWLTLVLALTLAYELTGGIGVPIAIALAQLLAKALTSLVAVNAGNLWPSLVALLGIFRVGAIAGLILVETRDQLWWAVGLLVIAGLAGGIVRHVHTGLLPRITSYQDIPALNRKVFRVEQLCALAGPLIAAGMLLAYDHRTAFAVAAVVSYISLFLVRRLQGSVPQVSEPKTQPSYSTNPFYNSEWSLPAEVRNLVTALVVVAALAAVVRLTLLDAVFDAFDQDAWVFGALVAIVALGAMAGPPPMDKVLSHFPLILVSGGAVAAVAVGAMMIGFPVPVYLAVPVLLGMGLVFVTLDTAARITFRRAIPEHRTASVERDTRMLTYAGQSVALLCLLLVSDRWGIREASVLIGVLGLVLVAVHFLLSGGLKTMERVVAPSRETPGGSGGA